MKPEARSQTLLGITRAKAKMYEYHVPAEDHIEIPRDPARLFSLAIGLLGDLCARLSSGSTNIEEVNGLLTSLRFSAQFFDAYIESRLDGDVEPYVLLLGSASYYLCELPGSASVLARRIPEECPDLDGLGLETLVLWLVGGALLPYTQSGDGPFTNSINRITSWFTEYYQSGNNEDRLLPLLTALRDSAYAIGTERQLLFADVACALARKRLLNSARYSLPRYSEIGSDIWSSYFARASAIRELWPAQHLLGEMNVFRGQSAIVQMPTSAGKTRGTELIIRSSFLSRRSRLAVIVAPFRALCHELKRTLVTAFAGELVGVDELSDVAQTDFDVNALLGGHHILIVTPEKLVYVLRHSPQLARAIGLIVYDEGHQFDNGTRGVTYELLLTSLKALIPQDAQTVLISAVISNADNINNWLTGGRGVMVSGTNTSPTYRSMAFTSWPDRLGRLEFVSPTDPDVGEFFVPRVIEELPLALLRRERTARVFPKKDSSQAIALYLGLKLLESGSVAVFCGTKASAAKVAETIVDAFDRDVALPIPITRSNEREVNRLVHLHELNLGAEAVATRAARLGVLSHHGNTPHGIRICVEHALREGLASFVICTSTLAQGVNLPIRYLVITSTYQGADRIKTRDFHNLIGRAGRAGMYTEGSIIFSDPKIYDQRASAEWRWRGVKTLANPHNSEPCASTLLSVFEPFKSDDGRFSIQMQPMTFVNEYITNPTELLERPSAIAAQHSDKRFTEDGLMDQVAFKVNIIAAVESYLMAYWDETGGMSQESVATLARGTLAYHLADEVNRQLLIDLFLYLAENIRTKVSDPARRQIYGKLLYGVRDSQRIQEWVTQNIDAITTSENAEAMLSVIWPALRESVNNQTFKRTRPNDILQAVTLQWIQGAPFHEMLNSLVTSGVRLGDGPRARYPKSEHAVDIGENALGYDGMLLVGAIAELYGTLRPEGVEQVEILHELQKRLKYGLPTKTSILLYEIGFADREVAMRLSALLGNTTSRAQLFRSMRQQQQALNTALDEFPAHFMTVFDTLMAS